MDILFKNNLFIWEYVDKLIDSNIRWNKRIESELLDGDTELAELALVGLDHVGVGLSDLFEGGLDLSDRVTLKVLDFLEGRSDDAKSLWINSSGGEQLINLGIFGFETLLDCLMFLLKNEVPETSLLVHLVDQLVELLLQVLLLALEILVLLESNFVLPFDVFCDILEMGNALLSLS